MGLDKSNVRRVVIFDTNFEMNKKNEISLN